MPESLELPILGPGIAGRSRAVTAQKRQNLFIDIKIEKDKNELVAYGTPGLTSFCYLGAPPVRGLWWLQADNLLFATIGDRFVEVHADGTFTNRGTLETLAGYTSMADNGLQVMIVDGDNGYIYQPHTGDLPFVKPKSVKASYSTNGTVVTVTTLQPIIDLYITVGQSITITQDTGPVVSGTYTITAKSGDTFSFNYTSAAGSGYLWFSNTVGVRIHEVFCNRKTGDQVEIKSTTGSLPGGMYTVTRGLHNDGNLVVGQTYVITSVGSSYFTNVGAPLNEVGVRFTATGKTAGNAPNNTSTAGTGTVIESDYWYITDNSTDTAISGTLQVVNNFRNIKDTYDGKDFPGANTVAFIDSYFVINNPNTKQFWLSGQYDGFFWDPLQFASKEAYTDDLLAVAVDNGNIVLFGAISLEYWQNTGDFPFPFQRIAGSPTEVGVASRMSIARCANQLCFLGLTRRGGLSVFMLQNYQPVAISTPDLDFLISNYENPSDAIAFTYRQNGHEFYQINFQTQKATWLYDATSQAWSVLQSGESTRHYANRGAQYYNKMIVSDYRDGNLYVLDPESYTDNGDLIARELITPHFFVGTSFNKLHIYRLRLDMEQGASNTIRSITSVVESFLTTESSSILTCENDDQLFVSYYDGFTPRLYNPQIMLQVSRDGGYTYGNEMWTSFGAQGEYLKRAEWRRLGVSRNYVFKFRITDPVKVVFISSAAYATQAAK